MYAVFKRNISNRKIHTELNKGVEKDILCKWKGKKAGVDFKIKVYI